MSYRSTREIVDCAEHVLGPLMGDVRPVAPRAGAPVESFAVRVGGRVRASSCRTRSRSWCATSPTRRWRCSRATRSRRALYYEALARAEVPSLRLVADQDFSFTAGIDVTDVRQSKGLEFDIVILLDVTDASYPATDDARRLLHVAMTRAAHQLWVTYSATPSPLLPDSLR